MNRYPSHDALYQWCIEQQHHLAKGLQDMEAGRWRIGRIENGDLIDETAGEIADRKRRLAQLHQILETLED